MLYLILYSPTTVSQTLLPLLNADRGEKENSLRSRIHKLQANAHLRHAILLAGLQARRHKGNSTRRRGIENLTLPVEARVVAVAVCEKARVEAILNTRDVEVVGAAGRSAAGLPVVDGPVVSRGEAGGGVCGGGLGLGKSGGQGGGGEKAEELHFGCFVLYV